jgi:Protein of unknown function (DUF3313)
MRGLAVALIACSLLDLAGCAATRGRRGEPERSGFLGDYSELAPREGYEAQLVYVNPAADWSRYRSVYLHSVTLWADEQTTNLSPKDRQMLADLLYKAMRKRLGTYFAIVDHPAADSIAVRAALTQAHGAKVALRTVSSFVPQALVLSTATGLATDTAATVGSATIEMEARDAITDERLAAAIDSRAGTKTPFTTRTFSKWADVEAACDEWAERAAQFLAKQGVQTKPGAPAVEK